MKKATVVIALTLIPALAAVALYGKPVERATALKDKAVARITDSLIKTQLEKILEKVGRDPVEVT